MARKLQIKRGLQANLPNLAQGELAMTVDSGDENIYIGTGTGENIEIARKSDVDALTAGVVGAVPTSRKINGKALTSDITLNNSDVGAAPTTHTHTKNQITDFPTSMTPTAHTHAAGDITSGSLPIARGGTGSTTAASARTALEITPANIGAVPTSRTINGKALSGDISLTATDVGAIGTSDLTTAKDEAAKTFLDETTGKLCSVSLINDNLKFSSIFLNLDLTSLISFTPVGSIVYNNAIYFTGYRTIRASESSSSYTYYFAVVAIDINTHTLIWNSGNLFSISSDYIASLYPSYTSMTCYCTDGSVIPIYYNGSYVCLLDLKNKTIHYNIYMNYTQGFFATDNYVGYCYASSVSDAKIYYKSRTSSGNSWSSYKSLGISIYSSYSYFGCAGVYGDIVNFVWQSSNKIWTMGQFNIAASSVTTGLSTITTNYIVPSYSGMQLLNGKVLISCEDWDSEKYGFVCINPQTGASSLQQTTNISQQLQFNNYFGTYNNLLYFVQSMNEGYVICAVNRDTGVISNITNIDYSNVSLNSEKNTYSYHERIFSSPTLIKPNNLLDLSSGTVKQLMGPYYTNGSQVYVYKLSNPNVIIGNYSDFNYMGFYGYSKNTTSHTLRITGAFSGFQKTISDIHYKS